MTSLVKDLWYGFRTLRRTPAFTGVAVFTLALGIGATIAVFSVVDAVLLRPLAFADQQRLTVLWEVAKKRDFGLIELSYPNYREWREQNKVFSRLAALTSSTSGMSLTGTGEPIPVDAAPVSSNFFSALGVMPLLGRAFLPEDDRLGASPVAILGYRLWQERFGADPHIIAREVRIDAQSYTVVGVMPNAVQYPPGAQLWLPLVPILGAEGTELRIYRVLKAIGRLKPGVSLGQAQADIAVIAGRLEQRYRQFNEGFSGSVRPLTEEIVGDIRPTLLILFAGVLFLLLIAVANVVNLVLARALERRHEIGLRAALGATRGQVMRQMLAEGITLGVLGGGLGLLLALLGIRLLRALAPGGIPRIDEVRLDLPALLFGGAVLLLASAVFGVAPALGAARGDLHGALKEGSQRAAGSVRSNRLRRLLVRSEVSLALVLLIGAGLMVQSLWRLQRVDLGFARENVLTARIRVPKNRYASVRERQLFFDRLLEQAAALPGVMSAATVLARPLDNSETWEIPIALEGQSWDAMLKNPLPNFQAVSPDYFRTLRIRVLQGRDFNRHDNAGAQLVGLVSKGLAKRFWPGMEPLGKRFRRVFSTQVTPWITVVGVVDDVHYRGLDQLMPDFYLPFPQNPLAEYMSSQDLVLRTNVAPLSLSLPLRRLVRSLDPGQAVASLTTLDEQVAGALAASRFAFLVMGCVGAMALCLAAVGIYGLQSYSVAQRSREIGIRMALGARRQEILRMVLAQGLKLTAGGLAAGLVAAVLLTRFMAKLLYGVSTLDPLTFVGVPLLLATVAAGAAYLPAARAARLGPTGVLHL
jgi:putative ABC transport system permease protein